MANKTKLTLEFDHKKVTRRINSRIDNNVQPALDIQVLKDSNVYAPQDIGGLIDSGIRATKPGLGKIIWDVIYSAMQYYTKNNKSTDVNPNATDRWFEVAKKRKKKDWIRLANRKWGG